MLWTSTLPGPSYITPRFFAILFPRFRSQLSFIEMHKRGYEVCGPCGGTEVEIFHARHKSSADLGIHAGALVSWIVVRGVVCRQYRGRQLRRLGSGDYDMGLVERIDHALI